MKASFTGNTVRSVPRRKQKVQVVLSLMLAITMAFGTLAPLSAYAGQPNVNGTKIDTYVQNTSLWSGYKKADEIPNVSSTRNNGDGTTTSLPAATSGQILRQNIKDTLYMRLAVTFQEGSAGTRTIIFNKPAQSTFTIGTDSSTSSVVKSVSAPKAETQVTITLKDSLPTSFDIFYTITYDNNLTPDGLSTDFTPTLKIGDLDIVTGDQFSAKVACETQLFPGIQVGRRGLQSTSSNFKSLVGGLTSPTATEIARVGGIYTYTMLPVLMSFMPDAVVGSTGYQNGSIPKTIKTEIILPKEAQLSGTPAAYDVSTIVGGEYDGHTLLTANSWGGLQYVNYSNPSQMYLSTLEGISVAYSQAPSGAAYEYSIKVSGTWQDDTPFVAEKKNIQHIYSAIEDPNALKTTLTSRITVDSKGTSRYGTGGNSFNNNTASLAVGDISNHVVQVINSGSSGLKDVTLTMPFDGDIWDIKEFVLGRNTLEAGDLKDITFVYSDSTPTKTVQFSDSSKFDQAKLISITSDTVSYLTLGDMNTWSLEGVPAGTYIKEVRVTVKDIAVNETLQFGLRSQLRETRRSGPDVIPKPASNADTANIKCEVTAVAEFDESKTHTNTTPLTTYPIYAQGQNPLGSPNMTDAQSGPAVAHGAGSKVAVTNTASMNSPTVSYNAKIVKPSAWIVVPDSYSVDNIKLYTGKGTLSPAYTQVTDTEKLEIAPVEHRSVASGEQAGSYNLYKVTYLGDMSYFGEWSLRVTYDVSIPASASAGQGKIETFYTENSGLKLGPGGTLVDYLDLDGDGSTTDNLVGFCSTFQVNSPAVLTIAEAASSDLEGATAWKEDGVSEFSEDNLAKGKSTGTLRLSIINGTSTPVSGTSYMRIPQNGTYPLKLASISAVTTNMSTEATSALVQTYSYTTSTAADLTTVPDAQWTTFTDPATVPTTAKGIRFVSTGQELPGRYRIDDYVGFTIPANAPHGIVYRANSTTDLSAGKIDTNSAGFKVVKPKVAINYYNDIVSAIPVHTEVVDADYAAQMRLDLGNTSTPGSLNYKKPAIGYNDGAQQGTVPYVVKDGLETTNIINVLYTKKTFNVPVEYYLEGNPTAIATDNTTYASQQFGQSISMTPGLLNAHKPAKGYENGTADCGDTYTVVDATTNKIKITYAKKTNLSYQIVYHTASPTGPVLGRSTMAANQTFGTVIDPTTFLDAQKPASGYDSGVAVGTWEIDDVSLNEFHVYYPVKAALSYSIDYYTGSVSVFNLIGSTEDAGTAAYGSNVELTQAQKDAFASSVDPLQFETTGVQTPSTHTMIDGTNRIKVIYPKVGQIEVSVKYVKANWDGTETEVLVQQLDELYEAGDKIVLSRELDNGFPGLGYTQGYQVGGEYTVVAGVNIITVKYDLDDHIPYIIEYYTEKAGGTLDRVIMRSTVFFATYTEPITLTQAQLDAEVIPGYGPHGTQLEAPHVLDDPVINTIKVSYPIKKDIPVTVNYYHDSVSTFNKIDTATLANNTFGTSVSVGPGTAEGQIDWKRPAGYKSGEATPATIIVGASENTINVVYTKSTYPVTVNYYKESVLPGNFLGSAALGNREFASPVTLAAGSASAQLNFLKPATGYRDGIQENELTVSHINGENVVNVVYPVKGDLSAQVIYHTGSVTGPVVGYSPVITGLTTGETVDPAAYLGTAPVGHKAGVADSTPWVVQDSVMNTFHVYYPVKDDLTYTIEYYHDSLDAANLIAEESGDTASFGDTITLDAATLNAHKAGLGLNYEDGMQEIAPYAMRDGDNVIKVVYPRIGSIQVTQKNIVKTMGEPDTVSYVTLFDQLAGDDIELTPSQIAKYAPQDDHHAAGVQNPAPYNVKPTGDNEFTVTWPCLHAAYTVNYYTDSISPETQIWSTTTAANFRIGEKITLSDAELTLRQPVGYGTGVQTPAGPYTLVSNNNVISVVFPKKAEMTYTIEYYLEGSDTAIGSHQVAGAEFGAPITIGTGTNAGESDWKLPAEGYLAGVPNADNPKTVGDSGVSETVVKVTYPKKSFGVTINYYTDSVSGTLVGTGSVATAKFGDVITLTTDQRSANCPAGYVAPGTQDGGAYTVVDGTNTINVVFAKKANLMAQVVYHTGSVAGPVLTRSAIIKNLEYGSTLDSSDYLGTAPAGYKTGVASGTWTILDTDINEFHVYYPVKDDLVYKIRYHKDSATGDVISTSADSTTTHEFGEPITLSTTELNAEKVGLGAAYGNGVQVVTPYTMIDGENIIDVYYPKLNNQSVTVKYVTETLSGDSTVTETLSGKNVGDTIEFTPSEIAAHAPAGSDHEAGVQTGGIYTVVDGANEITVRYALKSAFYTVKYYRDSIDDANFITQAASSAFKAGQGITLTSGELAPSGLAFDLALVSYLRTGEQTPAGPFTLAAGTGNVINVVFAPDPAKQPQEVVVKYFTQDKDLTGKTEIASSETTLPTAYLPGERVILSENQRNANLPAKGFRSGEQQDATGYLVVAGGPNVIEVTYPRKSDLTYQIEYRLGSASGSVLTRSTVVTNQIFEDEIELSATQLNAEKPAKGYFDGIQDGGFSVFSAFSTLDTADQSGVPYVIDDAANTIVVYYPLRDDLSYTINYYKDSTSGELLGTHTVDNQTFGDLIEVAEGTGEGQLDWKRPQNNYQHGVLDSIYTVDDPTTQVNVVYRLVSNEERPVINVNQSILYVLKGTSLTQAEFLSVIGARVTDPNGEVIPTSAIEIEGWESVNFNQVNYPGTPYMVRLTVTNSEGNTSLAVTAGVFVLAPDTPVTPVDPNDPNIPGPAPEGKEWAKDAGGNYILVDKGAANYVTTTKGNSSKSSTSVKTGDANSMVTGSAFTALLAAAVLAFVTRAGRGRKRNKA